MSTTSVWLPTSYTVFSVGSLTTLWTPPPSCLSTTTSFSGSLYLGTIPAVGTDQACYPPQSEKVQVGVPLGKFGSSTVQVMPTPAPSLKPREIFYDAIDLYSPGLCPIGWNYVASFVTTPARAVPSTGFTSYSQATGAPDTYFCCPDGYELGTVTQLPSPTIQLDYMSCTFTTSTYLENVFTLEATTSWPSSLPTPLPVTNIELNDKDNAQASCTTFTVTASGILVAWAPTDTAVMQIILNGSLEVAEEPAWNGIPYFIPLYPTPRPKLAGCTPGNPTWLLAAILPAAIIGGGIFLCCGCCCWAYRRNKKKRAAFVQPIAGQQGPYEEQIPLKTLTKAHIATHFGPKKQATYDTSSSQDEERPPDYDETLMMDDSNSDSRNPMAHDVMRTGPTDREYRHEHTG